MKTVVVACSTLKQEILHSFSQTGIEYPVEWVPSGLHNFPDQLRGKLQEILDGMQGVNRVLLAFGFCGNSMIGLESRDFELILPRVDDCITLLLGSREAREQLPDSSSTYFLTKGWMDGERNIWVEYQYAMEKYGPERGNYIFQTMFGNYRQLAVLDTDSYPLDALLPETEKVAEALHLSHCVYPASIQYLKNLFTGPWPREQFVIVPPFSKLTEKD